MSEVESPSVVHRRPDEGLPRHPHREIAELLAAAISRIRARSQPHLQIEGSEVRLGFTAHQSVNANPSYTEGVRE